MKIFGMHQLDEMISHVSKIQCREMKVVSGKERLSVKPLPLESVSLRELFNLKMDEIESARQSDSPCFHNILVEFYSNKEELMAQMVMTIFAQRVPGYPVHFIDAMIGSEVSEKPGFWHNKKV